MLNIVKKFSLPFVIGLIVNYYFFGEAFELISLIEKIFIGGIVVGYDLFFIILVIIDYKKLK